MLYLSPPQPPGIRFVQISASTSSTLPIPASYRRDGFADSAQQGADRTAVAQNTRNDTSVQGEITRIRHRASVSAQRGDNGSSQQQLQDLPQRSRSAVQAYLNNGPSIQERLGVELAGVDVYA